VWQEKKVKVAKQEMKSKKILKIKSKSIYAVIYLFVMLFIYQCSFSKYNVSGGINTNGSNSTDKNVADVIVNGSTEYQTIDGFGGSEARQLPDSSRYATIFDDIGVSILRFQMYAYTESLPDQPGDEARDNDNDDPFVIDWSGVKMGAMNAFAPLLKAAQSRGVKIIGTTWSPPAWMKDNGLVESSDMFTSGYEDELVEFILIWVKGMQMYHGVHIDSVTIQNEPDSLPSWPGCKYSPAQITDIIKRLGARFAAEGITTEIHAPDTTKLKNFLIYGNDICRDKTAKGYVNTLATHPYKHRERFNPDYFIPGWVSAYNLADSCGKKLWETEYGAPGNSKAWNASFVSAQHIHNALVYGNVAAWLHFDIYSPGSSGSLVTKKGIHLKSYVLKQYYHYVRPGAVRIDTQTHDNDILVTAFNHKLNNTLTVVVINRKASSEILDFSLNNLPEISVFNVTRTSAAEKSADLGQVSVAENSFTYILPGESITTFTGNY
jgi:O-glycosyl hydrolase